MNLVEVVAEVLHVDPSELGPESGRANVTQWDSIAHLNVIGAVEETYDVIFSSAEMRELNTIGKIRLSLEAKGVDE